MDAINSSVPAASTHWSPASHVDTISETISQPSTPADTSILRSVETSGSNTESCDSALGGDDDVQIIFSVPRRRKKKRKSFNRDSLRSTAVFNRQSRHHDNNFLIPSKSERIHQTQRSVPLSEPLHSYQQPAHAQRRNPTDETHFPSIGPSIFRPNYDYQQPPVYFSPYGGNQNSECSSLPTPWWEPAPTRTLSNPVHDVDWRSQQADNGIGSKRRHYGDWEMPPRYHNRQSMQISPRTNPATGCGPQVSSSYGTNYSPQDMYGRSCNGPSSQSIWPSFDLNAFNEANTNSFISQSLQQAAILTKPPTPNRVFSSNSDPQQPEMSQQPTPQVISGLSHQIGCPLANVNNSSQNLHVSLPMIDQTRNIATQATTLPTSESQSASYIVPSLTSQDQDNLQTLQKIAPPQAFVPEQSATALKSSPSLASIARPSDIERRPSLYKIPLWPPSSVTNTPEPSSISKEKKGSQLLSMKLQSLPRTSEQATLSVGACVDGTAKTNGQQQASKDNLAPTHQGQFQVPQSKSGRKHSPNLIVDIAETCQELFPFASVAERHRVPLKKVFDTFSAIIQLPLLRNADDRRRHGSLGKQRVKEYRDAKKAQERAREADRKTQMKVLRARVEEAGKKSKETSGKGAGVKANKVSQSAVSSGAMEVEKGSVLMGTGSRS